MPRCVPRPLLMHAYPAFALLLTSTNWGSSRWLDGVFVHPIRARLRKTTGLYVRAGWGLDESFGGQNGSFALLISARHANFGRVSG